MEEERGGGDPARRLHRHPPAGVSSNGLTLSLPLPLPLSSSAAEPPQAGGDRLGRDDIWSPVATDTLVRAWGGRYLQLNRGNLNQKHWEEVADAVNRRGGAAQADANRPKTDVQCKNRLDTLKKKYKVERGNIFAGEATQWVHFPRMDNLVGPSREHPYHQPQSSAMSVRQKRPLESTPDELIPIFNNNSNKNITIHNNNHATGTLKESPDMTESCFDGFDKYNNGVHVNGNAKKTKFHDDESGGCHPFKELAGAVLKLGEVYERIEGLKQQQMMDLEKQRMEFTKDLELQRMQLFRQTQLELAKIKHGKSENTDNKLEGEPFDEVEVAAWEDMNLRALAIINLLVANELTTHLQGKNSVADAWKTPKEMFETKNES